MKETIEKKNYLLIIFFLLIFGSFLRTYNVNYNDFWSDEMVSFWVADPNLSFSETFYRIFSSNWMVLFEFCLKYFHIIFGYDVNISRYFSVTISIASLIAFTALLNQISNRKSVIFGLFILSINIYHLSFSIELRSYIFSFFFVILFIYLVFKKNFFENNFKTKVFILNIILVLMLLCHPFTLLVVGSYIVYSILESIKNKGFNKNNLNKVFSFFFTSFLFLVFYFQTTLKIIDPNVLNGISPDWMWQVKPSFYTNFYFSKFFGSRILGIIHLVILVGLLIKFYKSTFLKFNIFTFFIILIFMSYFIPLIYGYIFSPILLDRYIFFILIPIIALLSHFIFKIESKIIRIFLIFLICGSSFLNNLLYENSFKQFYTSTYTTKPEIKKALKFINNSEIKVYTLKEDNRYSINTNLIVENYLLKCNENLNLDLDYISFSEGNIKPSQLWVVYVKDTINDNFLIPSKFKEYKITNTKSFNRLELNLLSK